MASLRKNVKCSYEEMVNSHGSGSYDDREVLMYEEVVGKGSVK
jgi:hypothetical protein